jgi:acyl-CoA synthetase (NDP forming)
LAHSSRLAGSARAYDALFRASGIASVQSVEALAGGCAVLAAADAPLAQGDRRLVAVTTSGAGGALLADAAFLRGIPLAGSATGEWTGAAGVEIGALPARGWLRNPIDMGSLETWAQLNDVYAALEQDNICGPTAVYAHIAPSPAMDRQLVAALASRRERVAAPIVVVAPGGLTADIEADYHQHGIPLFHDSATCLDSLDCHYQTRTAQDPPDTAPPPNAEIAALLDAGCGQEFLSELASAAILRAAGVKMVQSHEVSDPDQAALAAQALGYPVVLKALAPGIAHKHDAGLVQIGLETEPSLRTAFHTLLANVVKAGASQAETRFVLQPMLKGQAELILGVSHEASLGHFLVLGLGGINTELLDQVVLLPVPSTRSAIIETLAPTPLGRLLRKLAGGNDALLEDMIDNACAVQALIRSEADRIRSVDINPLLVTANGCQAVDALIVLAEPRE